MPDDNDLPEFDRDLIGQVARQARLQDVVLTGCILTLADEGPLQNDDLRDGLEEPVSIAARGSWEVDRDAGELGVLISFAITPDPDGQPFESAYFIGAEFRATYRLTDAGELEDEALSCFARWNGQFNTWPYMREFVQSTAARAGLGPIEVPLFRTPSAVPTATDTDDD